MDIIRFLILILILWNLSEYFLSYFSPTLGSMASMGTSGLLVLYFLFSKNRSRLPIPFVILVLLYFVISGLNFSGEYSMEYFKEFVRSMIVVICSAQVLRKTTKRELFFIFLIGGLSIAINAFLFPTANANLGPNAGRYSGFYLNPNFAGSICLMGYALSYVIKNKWTRLFGQFVFTLSGILTFSRTFIVIWVVINLIAIYQNRKNLIAPLIGAGALVLMFAVSDSLSLKKDRFSALKSIFSSEQEIQTKTIKEGGRSETWALYYDVILDKPFVGNGFRKLHGHHFGYRIGVHNSYLMVLGESGIIPFLIMVGLYLYLLIASFRNFSTYPEYFYLTLAIALFLLTGHGYFKNYYNIFLSMYVFLELRKLNSERKLADYRTEV